VVVGADDDVLEGDDNCESTSGTSLVAVETSEVKEDEGWVITGVELCVLVLVANELVVIVGVIVFEVEPEENNVFAVLYEDVVYIDGEL